MSAAAASPRGRLDDGLAALGGEAAALDAATRERLLRFVELLARWNRVHNLTAVREPLAMIGRHVLDSLALLPWLDQATAAPPPTSGAARAEPREAATLDLIDVGSGAGLPVLVLAIARPALRCLSIESNNKKVRFQRQAMLELGLERVEARHARVETVTARARVVLSRAFAAPADFLATAAPLCAPGGTALVMLGRAERLPPTLPAPFALGALHALRVPFDEGERHLAVCHKR